VALDGAGYHPGAWRDPGARAGELFDPGYWVDLAREAERGLVDFVSFDDTFGLQSRSLRRTDDRVDQVRGRLDASLVAAHVAPRTHHVGLIPAITTTYPEPFHIASATSTLDHVSHGRGGWQPRVSGRPEDAALVGVRAAPGEGLDLRDRGDPAAQQVLRDLFDEAADVVEVVRRLWDSWEDDAIIRDVATGRFVDRDKLHYIDFEGRFFSVRGPSIVPRPPQGQPVVAVLAHQRVPFELAARSADVVFVTPADREAVGQWLSDVRAAEEAVGRTGVPLKVFADLVVLLDETAGGAGARQRELDAWGGELRSDAPVVVGTPGELADLLEAWAPLGLDGFRLRPAVATRDLPAIVDGLVPELQRRGLVRTAYEPGLGPQGETLRQRFGLPVAPNRYAEARGA
jgi:alkanesulfonate monooxygenase SsuD/methylene tetrahydromethanopterin reductase-like flavin-dependent oxidoreductase (luciferase family)